MREDMTVNQNLIDEISNRELATKDLCLPFFELKNNKLDFFCDIRVTNRYYTRYGGVLHEKNSINHVNCCTINKRSYGM